MSFPFVFPGSPPNELACLQQLVKLLGGTGGGGGGQPVISTPKAYNPSPTVVKSADNTGGISFSVPAGDIVTFTLLGSGAVWIDTAATVSATTGAYPLLATGAVVSIEIPAGVAVTYFLWTATATSDVACKLFTPA